MKTLQAITHMRERSGTSMRALSARLGKSENYVSTMMQTQSDTTAGNLAATAEAMGYELILRGCGEEIRIDPSGGE